MKNLVARVVALLLTTASFFVRVLAALLSVAGLILLSLYAPSFIVVVLDANLAAIKLVASLVPVPYGAMGEVALREGLGADSAMFFWESWLIVKLAFWLIARPFRRVPSQNANQKKEVSK